MAVFDNFPYTNNHELNLDWIVKNTQKVLKASDEIVANTEIAQEAAENALQSELNAKASEDAAEIIYNNTADMVSDLTNQVSINTNDISVQTARIDEIISGSSADPDAELIDIRVGANGVTYPTAGDAVRELDNINLLFTSDLHYPIWDVTDWEQGTIYSQTGLNGNSDKIIRLKNQKLIEAGTIIAVPHGYRFVVLAYNASDQSFVESTGWRYYYQPYIIPEGSLAFRLLLSESPEPASFAVENYYILEAGKNLKMILPELYRNFSYRPYLDFTTGSKINLIKQKYGYNRFSYSLPATTIHSGLQSRQDIAVYNNVVFQLFNPDYVALFNLSDGSIINSYEISCGHGNSCQFSNEFYNSTDTYPLLYCFSYTTNKVYVNRVTENEATLIRTYKLHDGYRFSGTINRFNNMLYAINYHLNNSQSAENNYCIFSIYNLENTINNADGTITPELVYQRNIPFIYMIQGCDFVDNKILIACGGTTANEDRGIKALDTSGYITTYIPYTYDSNEPEGICIYDDPGNPEAYRMLFSTNRIFDVYISG